ncbi:MAG: hypothetical protein V3U42_05790, partial [candidate division NC10 bacterium]
TLRDHLCLRDWVFPEALQGLQTAGGYSPPSACDSKTGSKNLVLASEASAGSWWHPLLMNRHPA